MKSLTNMLSFNFLKKKDAAETLTEGVIEGYSITPDSESEHNYKVENHFKIKCDSPAICIKWYESDKLFVVGYESGHIGIYSYDPSKDIKSVKEIENTKIHNKRVLAVELDPNEKLIYSISKGNKLRVYNLNQRMLMNGRSVHN